MRPIYTTANAVIGAKLAGAIGHLLKGKAQLAEVYAAMDVARDAPPDYTKLEGGDFGGAATQGQAYFDAVGLANSQAANLTANALAALDNGG